MSVVGFDIGNENCYVGAVKSGGIEILDNEYSLRSTPTYIAFTENCRDIGVSAKSKVITNLENTVFGLKKILGKQFIDSDPDLKKELSYLPHEICKSPSGDIGIKVSYLKNYIEFSVQQLMAMILTKLKNISEMNLKSPVRYCVIAVPVYYTDPQRRAMLHCASIAGLSVVKLINESAAVALTFGFFKGNFSKEPQNVVFIDLGNSTLTVTACAFTLDKAKILGCLWEDIGGRDFDNNLVHYFVEDFKTRYQLDVMTSNKAIMVLMNECEKLKKQMSTNPLEVNLEIECFMENKDVSGRMKREVFEILSGDVLMKIEHAFRRILTQTQLSSDDIHAVELVGGSSRIPAVKQLIQKIFSREPNTTLNQDEAIARGCALQCALLSPSLKTKDFVVEDVPSYAIRFVWLNANSQEEELEVFSYSDKIPACKVVTLSMKKPFILEVRSVDFRGRAGAMKIGTYTFGNIPLEANEVIKVSIKTCLNTHGIFLLKSAHLISNSGVEVEEKSLEATNDGEEGKIDKPASENEERKTDKPATEKEEKPGRVVKLHVINSDVSGLSETKLKEYIDMEKQMISRDIEEKEKADARNDLEEHVYSARGMLSYDLYHFVTDSDRSKLLNYLNETENWLYSTTNLDASEYYKRLKEVEACLEPISKRSAEWKQRAAFLDEYTQILQDALNSVDYLMKQDLNKDFSSDTDTLCNFLKNSRNSLDQSMAFFPTLNKWDDVPQQYTIEELRKCLVKFQEEFQKCYSDLRSKINCAKEKAVETTSGDGVCQDPKSSDQNSGQNMQEEAVDEATTVKKE